MDDTAPPSSRPLPDGSSRYRLAMSPLARWLRVGLLVAIGLVFTALAAGDEAEPLWRAFAVLGVASCLLSLRIVVGPAVAVTERGLRRYRGWVLPRDVPWYRILEVEVVPVAWVLEVELNSGERFELPAVEDLNGLYDAIEARRHRLDA